MNFFYNERIKYDLMILGTGFLMNLLIIYCLFNIRLNFWFMGCVWLIISVATVVLVIDVIKEYRLRKMELKRKKKKLQDKYNLLMSVDMENEVEDMCNLSQGIVEDTTREVTRKVTKEVTKKKTVEYINNIMESMGCTIDQAMKALKINPNEYAMYKDLMGM